MVLNYCSYSVIDWRFAVDQFLFWNIGKRPLGHLVADLAVAHEIDVIILVECETDVVTMLQTLNQGPALTYQFPEVHVASSIHFYAVRVGVSTAGFSEPTSVNPEIVASSLCTSPPGCSPPSKQVAMV